MARFDQLGDTVAIQGEEGSNSAAAARELLGPSVTLLSCETFGDVFAALDGRRVPAAVLPVENTTAGLVQEVWDRLLEVTTGAPLAALAEVRVPIRFVAAVLPGSGGQIEEVLAHPVAAAQCRRFLTRQGARVVPCHDTAGAARLVREGGRPGVAALCPPGAAARYQLEVLEASCGDATRTWTRFLLIVPGDARPDPDDDHCVASLALPDQPGSLARALGAIASRGLNLGALHSRSVPGSPGVYRFLVEIQAGAGDPRCAEALADLRAHGSELRIIGSYRAPRWPADA